MTSAAAQRKQHEIKEDIPFVVTLMGREYKCRYLKEWVAGKISYEIVKSGANPIADAKELIKIMADQKALASKCIAMMILEKPWKIEWFHWWFWRKIYRNNSARDLTEALTKVYAALDLSFFFQNMILLDQMNILTKKMTKTELKQLSAELQSERNLPL